MNFTQRMALNIKVAEKLGWEWVPNQGWKDQTGSHASLKDWAFDVRDAITLLPPHLRPDPKKISQAFIHSDVCKNK
jgi:hypothetical protein